MIREDCPPALGSTTTVPVPLFCPRIRFPDPAPFSVSELFPVVVTVGLVPARDIVEPFTVRFPPTVVNPPPVVKVEDPPV